MQVALEEARDGVVGSKTHNFPRDLAIGELAIMRVYACVGGCI